MNSDYEPDFIVSIRFHAKLHGLTVYQLLQKCGVADSQWRRWKMRETEPRRSTLEKILNWKPDTKVA